MIGVSSLLIYFIRKTSSHRIFLWTTAIASAIFTLATLVLSHHPGNWFWTCFFIFSYITESALIACYWTFVDQYHDLQEAKRLYGIYNAAIFLGYVVSGALINQLINVLGIAPFLAATAISLFFCMGQIRKIARKCSPIEDDALDEVFSSGKRGLLTLLQNFCKSPYALLLVGMSLVAQVLRTCTEINFMETFSKAFDPSHFTSSLPMEENLIAEFLGKLKAFIYLGNIIFAMFFYRNCVRRFQLPNMLLIPPAFFLIVFGDWLVYDALFVAVLGVIAVEFFLFSLEDNNFNLLVNAAPSKLKGVLRIVNDSFFEPIGMLLSSGFLLLVRSNSKWFGFALALTFLLFAFFMKSIYSRSMLAHLKQNAIRFEKRIRDWCQLLNLKEKRDLKKDLLKALHSENEEDKLLAFEALLSFQDPTFLEDLIYHADFLSISGKIAWIRLLDVSSFSQDPQILEQIDSWAKASSSELLIKTASLFLAKRGLLHPEKVIQHLDGHDLYERTAAIITLKKSQATQSAAKAGLYRTIASKERDLLLKSEDLDEVAMGLEILSEESGREALEKAIPFLNHESLRIKRSAAKSVEKLADKTQSRYASMILDALQSSGDSTFRISCLEALGKIGDSTTVADIILSTTYFRPNERRVVESIITGMGLKTVPVLLSIIKNASIHNRCRILAAKILGSIALPQLQANLMDIINAEIERAYFYFLYGHTIPKQYPLYDLSLLQNTLLSGYQSVIDFIVYLLGIASSIEACDFLVHALHGKNAKARANAIETIEKNSDFKIFKEISPLLDDVPWESKIESFSELKNKFPKLSLTKLLDRLESSPSLFDRTVSAHLKAEMQIPNWKQSLREQIKTSDELFHHFAYELLDI
jgi:HEAT repeat protein